MLKRIMTPALLTSLMLVTACGHHKKEKRKQNEQTASMIMPVDQQKLNELTESWPQGSKSAIKSLTEKYGLPTTVSEDMVVWNNAGPFKRSVVYREEIMHQFPYQHSDVLVQTINYRVPLEKVDELAKFDGSILIDRTRGEISSRDEKEEMNILALNLSDKIVKGEMSPEEARREYSKNAEAFAAGTTNNLLTTLSFRPQKNTMDPDTMMQSQEFSPSRTEGPVLRKTIESEEVEEVIE